MYSVFSNAELAAIVLMLIVSLISANKASKLIYSRSERELHVKTRKLKFWTVLSTMAAALAIICDVAVAASMPPVFWLDRLLLRAPLALLAILLLWLMSWPRLRMLLQRTQSQGSHAPDMPRRRHATDSELVVPYKWTALIAAGIFYFALAPPVPFQAGHVFIPSMILLFAALLLWMHQSSRNTAATTSEGVPSYRPWNRRLRITGIAAMAGVLLSVPLLVSIDASRHPGVISMMAGTPDYGMIRDGKGKLVKADAFSGGIVYLSVDQDRSKGILMSPDGLGEAPPAAKPAALFDPTHYGEESPTSFNAGSDFDREFTMILDNRLTFFDGVPALYDTINGKIFPCTPMFVVKEGELVKATIINRGSVDHPLHLHGHHMLVLSRNGEAVTGSPWWSDTLDVTPGDIYEVAFLADNPGL